MDFMLEEFDILSETYDVFNDIHSKHFKEFCRVLDEMDTLYFNYNEAVSSVTMNINNPNSFANKMDDNINTTKGAANLANAGMDAYAGYMRTEYSILGKALSLVGRVIGFLLDKIMAISTKIVAVMNGTKSIKATTLAKISGDIALYITCDDIHNLYKNGIMDKIKTMVKYGEDATVGITWGRLFHPRGGLLNKNAKNDIKLLHEMQTIHNQISTLEFVKTIVPMTNSNTIRMYLGNVKSIKISDSNGINQDYTYYEALHKMMTEVSGWQEDIRVIKDNMNKKYSDSRMIGEFAKLSEKQRKTIIDTINMLSTTFKVLGNIVKYINVDMNTIAKEIKTIQKAQESHTQQNPQHTHITKWPKNNEK